MRDDGNLMLLAGIVVTIAFVTTALTLSQVATLERQAVTQATSSLGAEWRFIRERIAGSINASVAPDTRNETLLTQTLPAIVATYRGVEAEKGYDVVIRPATLPTLYNRTEWSLLNPAGTMYDAYTFDGMRVNWAADPNKFDGLLWRSPCADPAGPTTGCISGMVLSIQMTDGESTLHEVLVLATNTG
ncbi:MAG TPA: hypothetical protein VNX21_09510 [Candidatus Thermoplasmatota archaeon]|nr:hypothetical protein [Candidatus Thermoplasmatota archaeon]